MPTRALLAPLQSLPTSLVSSCVRDVLILLFLLLLISQAQLLHGQAAHEGAGDDLHNTAMPEISVKESQISNPA
jgi:hypothetical protein